MFTLPGIGGEITPEYATHALLFAGASTSRVGFESILVSEDGRQVIAEYLEAPGATDTNDLGSISVELNDVDDPTAGGMVHFTHAGSGIDHQVLKAGPTAVTTLAGLLHRELPERDQAGADGDPFLSVVLDETSFVYDGIDNLVYISPDGYGEPVTATFDAPDDFAGMVLDDALSTLRSLSQEYLDKQRA